MHKGVLSHSLETEEQLLIDYLDEALEQTEVLLYKSDCAEKYMHTIEKCVRYIAENDGYVRNPGLAVETALTGFTLGVTVGWNLENSVGMDDIDLVLRDEQDRLEAYYERLQVHRCSQDTLQQWGELSEIGKKSIPGVEDMFTFVIDDLGYDGEDYELKNLAVWGGIGAFVFVSAAKNHYKNLFSGQLADFENLGDMDEIIRRVHNR